MRRASLSAALLLACFAVTQKAAAATPSILTYHYLHHLVQIPTSVRSWQEPQEVWVWNGQELLPPSHFRVDGDRIPPLPKGWDVLIRQGWNRSAIRATIAQRVASVLDRKPGSVTISRAPDDTIVFDGIGFPGRTVDLDHATDLTIAALEEGTPDIMLPVIETKPTVIVLDRELQKQGIAELVTMGESDFTGSPVNRQHNIKVGVGTFNGHLIPKDAVFSFNDILGTVDKTTGYREELVIKGEKTEPDYGGGLCQVSTTAYRGVWEYGFPIVERRNHSYAVSYYGPQGSDATVWPGSTDMKFRNDGPSSLLMQTHLDNGKAYFLYYGTRDDRTTNIFGPYTWDPVPPPEDKLEFTTDLPPGVKKKVGDRHPGMKAAWFRQVTKNDKTELEAFYSVYEARPLFEQIGAVGSDITEIPDWIGEADPAG